jgi:hypothetical protein
MQELCDLYDTPGIVSLVNSMYSLDVGNKKSVQNIGGKWPLGRLRWRWKYLCLIARFQNQAKLFLCLELSTNPCSTAVDN